MARPVATYAGMVRSLANADPAGRTLMIRLAAAGSGREALAVYLAAQGTVPADAAAVIGCDVAALDAAIEAYSAGILAAAAAERARRAA
jgi:hypothetical protein